MRILVIKTCTYAFVILLVFKYILRYVYRSQYNFSFALISSSKYWLRLGVVIGCFARYICSTSILFLHKYLNKPNKFWPSSITFSVIWFFNQTLVTHCTSYSFDLYICTHIKIYYILLASHLSLAPPIYLSSYPSLSGFNTHIMKWHTIFPPY